MPTFVGMPETEQHPTPVAAPCGVLRAFSSYSWKNHDDIESIGRLVCELRLRGLTVFRDLQSLNAGASVEAIIAQELARSALVMPLLTPDSLASDPVVEMEFKRARDLQREHGRPALAPVVRNLGADQAEVTANTWERLKYVDAAGHPRRRATGARGGRPDRPARIARNSTRRRGARRRMLAAEHRHARRAARR